MDCLVDDKMNSNLPPSCPKCGLDPTSAGLNPSLAPFALCENCKCAVSNAAVNNNPMPQTHRDLVLYPSSTRPRWCSCLDTTSTTSTSTDCSVTLANLESLPPASRPRSISSPFCTDRYPQYSTSSHTVALGETSSSCSHSNVSSSSFSHNHQPSSTTVGHWSSRTSHAQCSSSSSHSSPTTTTLGSPEWQQQWQQRPRLNSDSSHHTQWSSLDTPKTCSSCGCLKHPAGFRGHRSWLESESNSTSMMLHNPGSNINTQRHQSPPGPLSDEGDKTDGNLSTNPSPSRLSPPLPVTPPSLTVTPPAVSPAISPVPNQNTDQSPTRVSPWGRRRRSRGQLSSSGNSSDQTQDHERSPSPFRQYAGTPGQEINVMKTDLFCLRSDRPASSPSSSKTPTKSQIISHNMAINRITTSGASSSSRSPRNSIGDVANQASQKGRKSPRVSGIATGKSPFRHSLHTPGNHSLKTLGPDYPVSILPQELLYDLHDLDHENEDLLAEVVYSLHFKDYEIKELLGKGISSTVRRVTEKTTGVEYAVKIIDISGEKGETSQVEQTKKDTYREIKILRMCGGHPHIIELHDVFETPTFIFLVFEICKKGELFDYLTSVVSLSEKRTRIFMRQLIEAVAFFHEKNIVHRDLKPENILLDDNLNIKVSDFGFATVVEDSEELSELCGTPGYLAPEVLAHSMYENVSGYGKEVDMWACGVIMYTLLCGAPPFWNRRQMMMLRAIMNADYTFNSPEWDDITDAPKNLIRKLLLVNPKERLTAKQALQHPFFHSQIAETKKFHAHRKFRAGVFCVMFYNRLHHFYKHPPPISVDTVRSNPYSIKLMRKVIDNCAFGMYKHWVKRVDNQNRAALFEHTLRDDWKHSLITIDGIKA